MAVQAQLYSENVGFSLATSQDLMISDNNPYEFHNNNTQFCQNPENLQQNHQQQQHMNQYYQDQNFQNQNDYFSQNLAALSEKQKQEIDGYITLQNERLRWALQEHRKQQIAMVLNKYEVKARFLLRQKDEEIMKASNKTLLLQGLMNKVEVEKVAWERLAKENEAIALSLNNTIEQLKLRETNNNNINNHHHHQNTNTLISDEESCCDVFHHKESEEGEEEEIAEKRRKILLCRGCKNELGCMIMLPCRHLCLCKACEAFLHSCPVCGVQKKATLEALF